MSVTSHLWVTFHKHKDELQSLGPLATLVAATVAAGVTFYFGRVQARIAEGQRKIAAAQRDIAARRVQMDLHDKRFQIICEIQELMKEVLKNKPDEVRARELQVSLQQVPFFFPEHIVKKAHQIGISCVMSRHASLGENIPPGYDAHIHDARVEVVNHLLAWPLPFSEVMTFRDVE